MKRWQRWLAISFVLTAVPVVVAGAAEPAKESTGAKSSAAREAAAAKRREWLRGEVFDRLYAPPRAEGAGPATGG